MEFSWSWRKRFKSMNSRQGYFPFSHTFTSPHKNKKMLCKFTLFSLNSPLFHIFISPAFRFTRKLVQCSELSFNNSKFLPTIEIATNEPSSSDSTSQKNELRFYCETFFLLFFNIIHIIWISSSSYTQASFSNGILSPLRTSKSVVRDWNEEKDHQQVFNCYRFFLNVTKFKQFSTLARRYRAITWDNDWERNWSLIPNPYMTFQHICACLWDSNHAKMEHKNSIGYFLGIFVTSKLTIPIASTGKLHVIRTHTIFDKMSKDWSRSDHLKLTRVIGESDEMIWRVMKPHKSSPPNPQHTFNINLSDYLLRFCSRVVCSLLRFWKFDCYLSRKTQYRLNKGVNDLVALTAIYYAPK